MAKNAPPVARARAPQSIVTINGVVVPALEWDVTVTALARADRASLTCAASALPAAMNAAAIASAETVTVEIRAGAPDAGVVAQAADLAVIFVGEADTCRWEAMDGTITLDARSYAARLIDTTTSKQYRNQTASQVATILAGEHGLTPVVTATKAKIGRYYKPDTTARVHSERGKWDLLTWLAREEGFIVYVTGKELHFRPRPDAKTDAFVFRWTDPGPGAGVIAADAVSMEISRNITQTESVNVIVRSWNAADRRTYTATKTKTKGTRKPIDHVVNIPGLSQAETTARAAQILNEITRHNLTLTIDGPAGDAMSVADIIKVEGSPFDGAFNIDSIQWRFGMGEGLSWRIEGKTVEDGGDE